MPWVSFAFMVAPMKLIDIGANLTHQSFRHDLQTVIDSATAAGLAHILLTGTDLESARDASQLCAQQQDLFSFTAGFHPHVSSDCNEEAFAELQQLEKLPGCVAVGETGLDFNRNYSPRDQQIMVFEKHLSWAVNCQKPLFLHQRDAHAEFYPLLRKYRDQIAGGVVHCFTDTEEALRDYLDMDMYIGITGWICDDRRGTELARMVQYVPEDRLLIETDAPYLLPRNLDPRPDTRRNEPKFLPAVLAKIAECCDRSPEELAALTTSNAIRLFGLKIRA